METIRRTRTALGILSAALFLGTSSPLPAQEDVASPPAPRPDDVGSVDAIIGALYDVISGPAGEVRDWERFRSLFVPGARLVPVGPPPDDREAPPRAFFMSVEDYVERSGPLLEERGFFEREIGRVEERFDHIAHAFSTYESRWSRDGEVFQRGINSIQLLWDGERWWIVHIMWRGVGPDVEIPERYRERPGGGAEP